MLYNYSITYLKEDHFEERIQDICDIINNGVASMPLFMFQIAPKRTPPIDYITNQLKIYRRYREVLEEKGIPCGVLVQASLAINEKEECAPFQAYIGLANGEKNPDSPDYCPSDEAFRTYLKEWIRKIAEEHPKAIMLDDDFNLMMRAGKGCACPYHMAEFNRRAEKNWSREELYEYLRSCKSGDPIKKIYTSLQTETLVGLAQELRSIIDEIDPTIQGINCGSGHICDSVAEVNKVFCGKGNPTIVRIPNGNYAPYGVRGFSELINLTARCGEKVRRAGIEILISECDTIPYSRYAKSARYLHSHYTSALLDGLKGAKHWLSSFYSFQKKSGVAYRDILAKHKKFYEAISNLTPIRWTGINSAITIQEEMQFGSPNAGRWQTNGNIQSNVWILKHFEEMGIPFYYSDKTEPATFLEPSVVETLTDEEIERFFKGSVFLDAHSAKKLIDRGYQNLIGLNISDWDLGEYQGESFDDIGSRCCWAQIDIKKLQIADHHTEILSWVYRNTETGIQKLAPATTKLQRADGKYTIVFCGSPDTYFTYRHGFAFMNEDRKIQLTTLLREAGALPVYIDGDAELCVRAGYTNDGRLLCAIIELGMDPMEEICLSLEKAPENISMLSSDGNEVTVEYQCTDKDLYTIKIKVEPMYPVILLIQ